MATKKSKNPIKLVKDGFVNIIKGLGTSKDPRENTYYQRGRIIDQQTAGNLYTYNWLAAKVVDAPVNDATRKWRNFLISDPDKKKEVEDKYKELDVKGKINQAMKWSRVYGGAAIVILLDEDPMTPLVMENIRKDSLINLVVLDRYYIYANVIDRNILSPNFGQPEFYVVARDGTPIHHTRVIKFTGEVSTIQEYEAKNYWGNSTYLRTWEPISDSQVVTQTIADLIYESNVDVYRIDGLNELATTNQDDVVVNRLKLAHEMKSIINGIALDKEDEYDKKVNTFTQLPELDDRYIQKVSGASNIPVTRLLGVSPSGMNATGESDMLNYYDEVRSLQENYIRPRLDYLDQVIMASCFGDTEPLEYEFAPLKELSEEEEASVENTRAQRDQVYLNTGVIRPTDAMAELAENGTYVTIDENRVEEEIEAEEIRLEEFEEAEGMMQFGQEETAQESSEPEQEAEED